ncbi:CMRF35-like molecule 1, partial [Colossoma macropomum]|uniref:CMRF35-like molecule 1 n=1 Tax=Colossoma macropomum TaxID=42526 RepID=UPI001864AF5C
MWALVLLVSSLFPAGISAVTTVTGHRGQSVQIKCPYNSGYETNMKYLCRGECSTLPWGTKDIPVQSGSAEDQRFSLDDDTAARVFTINITNVTTEDEGTYWCGIKRTKPHPDLHTEILLLVKLAGISAVTTATGYRGQSVQIKCSYDSGYETNMKYLCRGECSTLPWGTKDIPVQSGSAEDQRFSLNDDTAARVFTI